MALPKIRRHFSVQEYLELERKSLDQKNEYVNGEIFAMTGASRRHNLIAASVIRELGNRLKGRPCEVYPSDMRVQVNWRHLRRFFYPDVTVVCGEPRFADEHVDTLLNPTVIIEVLSASTENYDRGEKFASYRRLPSLQVYALISQDRVSVECYERAGDMWTFRELTDLDDSLALKAIDVEIPLREVYDRIEFEDEEAE